MCLVEDIDFEPVPSWPVSSGVAQLANLIDTAIRCGIDLDYIDRATFADFDARVANSTRLRRRRVSQTTVERHRQNTRDGGFPNATMAAEDVAVCDPLLCNCILQRARDMLLPDYVRKLLRSILAGENLISHGRICCRLYRGSNTKDTKEKQTLANQEMN